MSDRSFRSVFMVASCAGAALGCYLVSLRVASERAALEEVETRIVLAQRDIRLLQTEIGTRGRLAQLERWNVRVLALSAPTADQFVNGGFELARMVTPQRTPAIEAPVVLAAAPLPEDRTMREEPAREREMAAPTLLHEASLKTAPRRSAPEPAEAKSPLPSEVAKPRSPAPKVSGENGREKVEAAKSNLKSAERAAPKPADKSVKPATRTATTKAASARDPLAPLPEKPVKLAAAAKPSGAGKSPAAKGPAGKQ